MLKKYRVGDEIRGEVIDFGSSGEGVVKDGAYPIFIPFAIKGEKVSAKLTCVKKDYAFADLIDVLSPSKDRIKPRCPYFGRCGGCDLQHIDRDLQQQLKRNTVVQALHKNAGLDIAVPMPVRLNDWEYRNKLSLPFGYNPRSKRVTLGFYEKRTHNVVPMKWCPLHGEWAAKLMRIVSEWANEYNISVYDEKSGKGLLRHLVARKLDALSVTVVINGSRLIRIAELAERLQAEFEDVALYVSVNTSATNVIMGESVQLEYGQEQVQRLGKISAQVSPLSFLQVNDEVRDALYDGVCQAFDGFDGDIVELYSGVGLLTAQLAARLVNASITAVEIVPAATENANELMRSLGFENRVRNVCADAADYVAKLAPVIHKTSTDKNEIIGQKTQAIDLPDEIKNSPFYLGSFDDSVVDDIAEGVTDNHLCANIAECNDISTSDKDGNTKNENNNIKCAQCVHARVRGLVLDPPRRGCDRAVLEAAIRAQFKRIVYVSCNPQTLARDLKILCEGGYTVDSVVPYDMFPQTKNIESLTVLSI